MSNFFLEHTNIDLYFEYIVPLENLISFGMTLFLLSLIGIIRNNQSNIIMVMLFFELMLYSLSFLAIIFSLMWGYPQGQIFSLLILSVAVAESAIGLALLTAIYRLNNRIDSDQFSYLKG